LTKSIHEVGCTIGGVGPEPVFDYVTDVSRMPEWIDAVVEAEAEGGPAPGRVIRSKSSMMGLKIKGTQRVKTYERPTRYAWGGDDPFPSWFEMTLAPVDGGTELRIVAELEPKGLPGGGLVVNRFVKKQITGMADALKRNLESS
jgi:uncharacterized protein YndB with AHSA1/START domain